MLRLPEFKGPEGIWSPEELLVGSVNACVMNTFLAYADAARLAVALMKAWPKASFRRWTGSCRLLMSY
jgi:organic hydroperoxide reductase OsmC/OhrA